MATCLCYNGTQFHFRSAIHKEEVGIDFVKGVHCCAESGGPLMALPSLLKGLPDMERGITRIFHRTANPAEFVQVLQALVNIAPQLGVQVTASHLPAAAMLPGMYTADAIQQEQQTHTCI